jgi:hypothetical protein
LQSSQRRFKEPLFLSRDFTIFCRNDFPQSGQWLSNISRRTVRSLLVTCFSLPTHLNR